MGMRGKAPRYSSGDCPGKTLLAGANMPSRRNRVALSRFCSRQDSVECARVAERQRARNPISEARVDHGVGVETTENHVNRAADRGCCVSACSVAMWFNLGGSGLAIAQIMRPRKAAPIQSIKEAIEPNTKLQRTRRPRVLDGPEVSKGILHPISQPFTQRATTKSIFIQKTE